VVVRVCGWVFVFNLRVDKGMNDIGEEEGNGWRLGWECFLWCGVLGGWVGFFNGVFYMEDVEWVKGLESNLLRGGRVVGLC
jgi:hypothetical protein